MNWGLIKYIDTISLDYINDIFNSIKKNIVVANEKDNLEAYNELLDFKLRVLVSKSFNVSKDAYSKSITSLITLYPLLEPKYKGILVEKSIRSLISKIVIGESVDSIDKDYVSLSYLSLINLLKVSIEDDNYDIFNKAIERIRENLFVVTNKNKHSDYFFYFITTLLCWIYFLKFQKKISYERYNLTFLEKTYENLLSDLNRNFISEFYKLYEEIDKGLWAIDNWEIHQPPTNVSYFALQHGRWLTFSLVLILLKYNYLINPNNFKKINLYGRFKYEFEIVKRQLDKIKISDKNYIDFIFNRKIESRELKSELNYKKEKIIQVFTYLKKEVEIEDYKIISQIPLSDEKINTFRESVGKLWEENTTIINLFKDFDKVNYLYNVEKRSDFGFFEIVPKMKFAFIDGDYFQEVFGLNSYGSELARSVNNLFFSKILKKSDPIKVDNINEYVSNFISNLENKNSFVIFADSLGEKRLMNLKYHDEKRYSFPHHSFNGISVINVFNKYKNYIFGIDFNDIQVDIYKYESNKWYNHELLVDVTETEKVETTDDIVKKLSKKDGYDYTLSEAEILERNNVNIRVVVNIEFKFEELRNLFVLDCN